MLLHAQNIPETGQECYRRTELELGDGRLGAGKGALDSAGDPETAAQGSTVGMWDNGQKRTAGNKGAPKSASPLR